MKKLIAILSLFGIILIAGCVKEEGKTWVEIDPIQCFGNAWEIDWIQSHDGNSSAYPRDTHTPGVDPEEIEIIKDYYGRQGVTIYYVKTAVTYETVCEACTCPQGYTLYLLVDDSNVDKMLDFGYKIAS